MGNRPRIRSTPDADLCSGRHPIGAHDRRRVARVPVELSVWVESESGGFSGVAADLGIGGMFIRATEPPAYGTKVSVSFESPLARGKLRIRAVVRWSTESGFGIQFASLGAVDTHVISLHLEHASRES